MTEWLCSSFPNWLSWFDSRYLLGRIEVFMITLTSEAIKNIKRIVIEDKLVAHVLRIKVIGGGCAGFRYDMYFDEEIPGPLDESFVQDDVTVVIDPLSLQCIDGTEIDYVVQEFQEGFKVNNPNITAQCGCGSSFK